jgi:hypothetical protein
MKKKIIMNNVKIINRSSEETPSYAFAIDKKHFDYKLLNPNKLYNITCEEV